MEHWVAMGYGVMSATSYLPTQPAKHTHTDTDSLYLLFAVVSRETDGALGSHG